MPAIDDSTSIKFPVFSGNSTTDSLLYGTKWDFFVPTGSGVTLTYSFPTDFTAGTYLDNDYVAGHPGAMDDELDPGNNPHGLNASQQTQFTAALATWSHVANITFNLVSETPGSGGT